MAPEQKRRKCEKSDLPNLPKEIWCIIFSYLTRESRKNATSTCKFWFEIIRGNSRFSGNISIPWSKLQNSRLEWSLLKSNFNWDNWPSLKNLDIIHSSFPSPKLALEAMKDIDFKKCQSLEKVTFGVNFDVAELSRIMITTTTKTIETKTTTSISGENTVTETEKISTSRKYVRKFMKEIGTVWALAFNPKSDIDIFKLEHIDKLEIHMRFFQHSNNIERTLKIMKILGGAAVNLQSLSVGGESFNYPQFFETGFKNFGTSLKVLTILNGCFENLIDYQDDPRDHYVNSLDVFFKSLNENCPNLSRLNLGNAHQLRRVNTYNQLRDYKKIFSTAGFDMVKELNVYFAFFNE